MASFERKSHDGSYVVTIASGSEYHDGGVRIEPPVELSEDIWDLANSDAGVRLSHLATGKEATVQHFHIEDEWDGISCEERVISFAEKLAGELSCIESKDVFIKNYEG